MKNNSYNQGYPVNYPFLKYRKGVWLEIIRYIQKDVKSVKTIIELGAGYGDFINQFPAEKKMAFDLNKNMRPFYEQNVEFYAQDATGIGRFSNECADLVFASNFLEHLSQEALKHLMPLIHRALRPDGRFILLQPNYRLCKDRYFEDKTHLTVFSDQTMVDFLSGHDFDVIKLIPGLLPFSMQSRLPKWPILVRMYLLSPIKPLAAQMYIIAKKR
jgi:SAM-dependent methyltransferase